MKWFKRKTYEQKLLEARSKLAKIEAKPKTDFDYLETHITEWRNSKEQWIAQQKAEIARLEVLAEGEKES